MANESEGPSQPLSLYGRCPPPRVAMPQRGAAIGFCWSGAEGAGNQILAAEIECSPGRSRLAKVWRPFQDAPGRKDVVERFSAWMAEEAKWAEGRLTLGMDFPLSLAETHLRQLGLLRQSLRGPAALGRGLRERYQPPGTDFTEAADAFRDSLGKDRSRLADCYRAVAQPPSGPRVYRRTFFGLVTLAQVDAAFPPWESPQPGKPAVVEVYPAHVARALCGTCSYRDDDLDRSSARAAVLRSLRNAARLEFEMEQAAQVVEDGAGGALDAVLSAVAAAAAAEAGFYGVPANVPRSEGWIYSVREEPWRGA
jgi:hypothetical protein